MAFKKLICNLLLDIHPIVTNRFTHPLLTKSIYKYYLNFHTICLEYKTTNDQYMILDINYTLRYAIQFNYIVVIKWCLKNGADVHEYDDFALRIASKNGHLEIVKLVLEKSANIYSDGYDSL